MSWKNPVQSGIDTNKKNGYKWNIVALAALKAAFGCEFTK